MLLRTAPRCGKIYTSNASPWRTQKDPCWRLIPGLQFNTTWTYSNNQYLLNSNNVNYGARIGANLLDVFSVSSIKKASLAREDIVAKQRLALAMTILSQVHLANIHYAQSLDAFTTLENYYEVNVRIRDQYRSG